MESGHGATTLYWQLAHRRVASPQCLGESSNYDSHWYLTKFINFQYAELKPDCRPHQAVMRRESIDY
jgi:hypothetical protein